MPKTSPKLKATKPKNVFEKPLQADFKGLFKALSKGVGHTAIGKWEEIGNDTVEALCAIGLSIEPNELAFLLVRRSLVKAMFDLVAESASPQLAETEQDADALIEQLDFSISTRPFHIDRQFLDRPSELRLVSDAQARHGMPMEQLQIVPFKEALFQSRNAEESLLAALNGCSRLTKQISVIDQSERTTFGAWFRRTQGQRAGAESVLAGHCLSFLDLSRANLLMGDFFGANEGTNLQRIGAACGFCNSKSNEC